MDSSAVHGAFGKEVSEGRRGRAVDRRLVTVDLSPRDVQVPVEVVSVRRLVIANDWHPQALRQHRLKGVHVCVSAVPWR